MNQVTKYRRIAVSAHVLALISSGFGIYHANYNTPQLFNVLVTSLVCLGIGLSTGLLFRARQKQRIDELEDFSKFLASRKTPGGWYLKSKTDDRWSANGNSEHVGQFKIPKEAQEKIDELTKLYGKPPDDLEYGYMKD